MTTVVIKLSERVPLLLILASIACFAPEADDTTERLLNRAGLKRGHLQQVSAPGAHLPGVNLAKEKLNGAKLRGANLYAATLSGADLRGTDLSYANFMLARLDGANLSRAMARGVDLSQSDLREANLSGAVLVGCTMDLAKALGANLSGAILTGGSIQFVDLSGARLKHADLRRADLSDSDLIGADLQQANLTGTVMSGVLYDAKTQWPSGFWPSKRGALLHQARPDTVADPLSSARELDRFLEGVEGAWKRRDWERLALVSGRELFFATSDEGGLDLTFSGEHRARFLHRLLSRGRLEGRDEGRDWRSTFRDPWKLKIVAEVVPTSETGFRGQRGYEAYAIIQARQPELTLFFKTEDGFWRIRGLYRNNLV